LVKKIAGKCFKKYGNYLMEFDDMVSIGFIGLIEAMGKFDASRGNKFPTYAAYRIKGAILDETMKLLKSNSKIKFMSLEDLEAGILISTALSAASEISKREILSLIDKIIKENLNELEGEIINLKYKTDLPLKDISKIKRLSRGRVSQIHKKALLKIKESLKSNGITEVE